MAALAADSPNHEAALEESLWQQVRTELRETMRPPFEIYSIIAINVTLVLICWFLINPALIARHTGLIFLPAVLASWAFCDVPATNLYGADPKRFLPILDKPKDIRREFMAKNIVLWILISPACVLFSIILAPSQNDAIVSLAIIVAVSFLPFGYLGVSSLMAPLLPFHKMPWRQRLKRRDTWWRWIIACLSPYVLATPAAIITVIPAAIFFAIFGDSQTSYLIGAILMTPWALLLWQIMLRITFKVTKRRHQFLVEFLSDPSRG